MGKRPHMQNARKPSTRSEVRLERRLLIASCAFAAAAVPVALLGYAATHGWGPLHDLDSGVAADLHLWAVREPGAVGFLEGVSTVLDPWPLRAVAVAAVAALFIRGERKLALWAGTTVLVGSVLGFTLKLVVGRSRPALDDPVSSAIGNSFPSGHALNSFVILGVLVLLAIPVIPRRWRAVVWGAAAVTVALVGFARISLGVHYVSDVVAGWLVGAGLIATTVVAFDTWRRPERRPAPEVLSEGVDPAASRAAAGSAPRESGASTDGG